MAFFSKKKSNTEEKTVSKKNSTLELIKETMAESQAAKVEAKNTDDIESTKREMQEAIKAQSVTLKSLVARFMQDKTQENVNVIINTLQNPKTLVFIPATVIASDEDKARMKEGGQIKLEDPIKITPVLLNDNQGNKVFPIFSADDAIPDDLKKKSQLVNTPFANCVNMLKNIKDVNTIVLDPFTANIRIAVSINNEG